jgi:hypothetical protein
VFDGNVNRYRDDPTQLEPLLCTADVWLVAVYSGVALRSAIRRAFAADRQKTRSESLALRSAATT